MRPAGSARWLLSRFAAVLGALLLCLHGTNAGADAAYSEDAVKAAYLYRFAGYVSWPGSQVASSPFLIDVIGDSGVAKELARLLPDHPINGHPARVRAIARMADLGEAQMLYVGDGFAGNVKALTASLGDRAILVVTDESEGLNDGGTINFIESEGGHVRFEVSLTSAARAGLHISSQLLSVAVRVKGGHLHSGANCGSSRITRELSPGCLERVAGTAPERTQ
jgi:hypothetical protein